MTRGFGCVKLYFLHTHTHAFAHGGFMDLEKEIELLKEKVVLLERIKELQDLVEARRPYIPYEPYIPVTPYIVPGYSPSPWVTTCVSTTGGIMGGGGVKEGLGNAITICLG